MRLVNTDGTAFSAGSGAYELPEAGKDTLGGIKQFAPEQTIGNVDGNIVKAAAAAPTKDESTSSSRLSILWRNSSMTLSPASRPPG